MDFRGHAGAPNDGALAAKERGWDAQHTSKRDTGFTNRPGEGRGGFGNRKEASEYHQELRKRLPGWSGGETGAAVSLAASGAATRSAAAAADAADDAVEALSLIHI